MWFMTSFRTQTFVRSTRYSHQRMVFWMSSLRWGLDFRSWEGVHLFFFENCVSDVSGSDEKLWAAVYWPFVKVRRTVRHGRGKNNASSNSSTWSYFTFTLSSLLDRFAAIPASRKAVRSAFTMTHSSARYNVWWFETIIAQLLVVSVLYFEC